MVDQAIEDMTTTRRNYPSENMVMTLISNFINLDVFLLMARGRQATKSKADIGRELAVIPKLSNLLGLVR